MKRGDLTSPDFFIRSALNSAGAVAASQLFYLGNGDHVVVTLDGVLQGRSSHGKLYRCLGVLAVHQRVDQAAAEAVAAADSIDDVKVVLLGEAVSLRRQPLPQQCFVLSFLSTSVTFIYYHLQGFLPSQRRRLRWYYGFI